MRRVAAVIRLAIAVLLYPAAFAALIAIAWTGQSIWWGIGVIAIVLIADQSWLILLRRIFNPRTR